MQGPLFDSWHHQKKKEKILNGPYYKILAKTASASPSAPPQAFSGLCLCFSDTDTEQHILATVCPGDSAGAVMARPHSGFCFQHFCFNNFVFSSSY